MPTGDLMIMIATGEKIINKLMDHIEKENPEWYSQSSLIMCTDDWLKWINGEIEEDETQEIIKEIYDFC